MVKPILVVTFPNTEDLDEITCLERIMENVSTRLNNDYHCFFVISRDESLIDPKFEVFFEKDFKQVKYEELKEIINNK